MLCLTVSQVMADKAKSFILAPSRLGRNPTESEDSHATAKPNFTGGFATITSSKKLTNISRLEGE